MGKAGTTRTMFKRAKPINCSAQTCSKDWSVDEVRSIWGEWHTTCSKSELSINLKESLKILLNYQNVLHNRHELTTYQ